MHFNLYIDDKIGDALKAVTQTQDLSRNAIIREAIDEWLSRHRTQWPEAIMTFEGIPDAPRFEQQREDSTTSRDDPFADTSSNSYP